MGLLPPAATKYKFDGIGKAGAVATFAAMAMTPYAAITQGFWGKILFVFLEWFYSCLASVGLVVLNIGVANVETLIEQSEFDGSFEDAFKIINAKGGKLSDAEKAAIDNKVIAAFRKFASFGRLHDS
jgi:ABC-type transport system involved in cytochrome c biogenesis permease subunit